MAAVPPPPTPTVEAVVVYPPRLPPLGGEAAFSAVQIGPQILKQTPRLDQALESTPGVSLFRRTTSLSANPTTQGVSLRAIAGSGAGRALVTLDGAPVNDPFGGWVIWTALPSEGLDGATIVRGAGAGPYGAGALTGVIALQERGAGEGLAALDVSAGERNSYRAAVSGGAPGLLVTASAETTDGYTPVRGSAAGAADQPLTLQDQSIALRAQHDFDGVQAAARLGVFQERRGAGLLGARSKAEGSSATFTLARPAASGVGGWRLQAWARSSDLLNTSVAVAPGRATTTPANNEFSTPAHGYGLNAALQGRWGQASWEAGADARWADGTDHEQFRVVNGAFTMGRDAGGKTFVGGLYLEGAYDQGPWIVTGGARVDQWTASDAQRHEFVLATGATTLNSPAPNDSGTVPTGRIGIRYTLTPDVWLRSAAYAGFRAPTLNELHRPFRVGNDITEANPLLTPEKLYGIEAGLGGDTLVHWQATLFYNQLNDPITNVTIGIGPGTFPLAGFIPAGGTLRQRRNAGEIDAWGVEGDASGDIVTTLSWRAAFAYTHARVDGGSSAPQLTGLRPAQTPEWTVTGGLDWRALEKLTLSAQVRYVSTQFDDDQNARRLPPGAELNARAAWSLAPGQEVYLAVDNLADAKISTGKTADFVDSYSEPRTFRVGYAYRR
ncbi:MAG: TonB-dependent receptor for transport vitamin [Phenylobacterium sp.]|uniref:TonB-dependent receptor n=1 Tax=Phenylobacterium sp. TaxID=1871053 RepID=UPI00262AB93D|nr:TonB-dependent receptor [Phenylobacterium sp.]MDB5498780.1 TonB-dependent receptor for transport vitamin [Phenylobacterium sp.]